jgi:hypothetical protein
MITSDFAGAKAESAWGMGSVGSYTKLVLALEPKVACNNSKCMRYETFVW